MLRRSGEAWHEENRPEQGVASLPPRPDTSRRIGPPQNPASKGKFEKRQDAEGCMGDYFFLVLSIFTRIFFRSSALGLEPRFPKVLGCFTRLATAVKSPIQIKAVLCLYVSTEQVGSVFGVFSEFLLHRGFLLRCLPRLLDAMHDPGADQTTHRVNPLAGILAA